jgi:hypothetical protein
MSELSEWKRALREPNALVWVAFFILVVVFGFAVLYGDDGRHESGMQAAHMVHREGTRPFRR